MHNSDDTKEGKTKKVVYQENLPSKFKEKATSWDAFKYCVFIRQSDGKDWVY